MLFVFLSLLFALSGSRHICTPPPLRFFPHTNAAHIAPPPPSTPTRPTARPFARPPAYKERYRSLLNINIDGLFWRPTLRTARDLFFDDGEQEHKYSDEQKTNQTSNARQYGWDKHGTPKLKNCNDNTERWRCTREEGTWGLGRTSKPERILGLRGSLDRTRWMRVGPRVPIAVEGK